MSSSQCLAILLIAAILHNWQLTNWRTDCTGCPLFLQHPKNCTEHKIILHNRIGFLAMFFATFCAPNRAPHGSFRVQLFVLQIVLNMGLFACNFLCSKSCSRWVFSRATFCAPNCAPDGCFLVQLFVLQIVLQMGLFACTFLCSKSCSRWVFSRAASCAPCHFSQLVELPTPTSRAEARLSFKTAHFFVNVFVL